MIYLILPTEQKALDRSQEICISQGCTRETTTYWFEVIKNNTTNEGAIIVPEEQIYLLTQQEVQQLKDYQYMYDNGWFNYTPII